METRVLSACLEDHGLRRKYKFLVSKFFFFGYQIDFVGIYFTSIVLLDKFNNFFHIIFQKTRTKPYQNLCKTLMIWPEEKVESYLSTKCLPRILLTSFSAVLHSCICSLWTLRSSSCLRNAFSKLSLWFPTSEGFTW